MRGLASIWQRQLKGEKRGPAPSSARPIDSLWGTVSDYAAEIRQSDFMAEMNRHLYGRHSQGLFGDLDGATLYGLTRWQRPAVVVESGGYLGMSSAFILKALADEGLTDSRLYSIEGDKDCDHGALIPNEFRSQFMPLRGTVEEFIERDELPAPIDMFLHDSSHRCRHMLWEFRQFWGRLRERGMLVSHDVHTNAAFAEFVAKTHAPDIKGALDASRTAHHEWGRWGYLGFVIKKTI